MAENMRWLAMSRHHVPCLLDTYMYDTKFTTDKNQYSYKRLRSSTTPKMLLIWQSNHILWVLKRTVSMGRFFRWHTPYVITKEYNILTRLRCSILFTLTYVLWKWSKTGVVHTRTWRTCIIKPCSFCFFFLLFFSVFFFHFYATYVQDTFRTCLNDHVSFAQQNYHTNTNYWLLYNVMKCTCFGARSHSLVTWGGQLYPESYSLWTLHTVNLLNVIGASIVTAWLLEVTSCIPNSKTNNM